MPRRAFFPWSDSICTDRLWSKVWVNCKVISRTKYMYIGAVFYMSRYARKRTFGHAPPPPPPPATIQIRLRIRAVWSESSLAEFWITKNAQFLHANNEESDQTWRVRKLIWVFVGRTYPKICFLKSRLIYLHCLTLLAPNFRGRKKSSAFFPISNQRNICEITLIWIFVNMKLFANNFSYSFQHCLQVTVYVHWLLPTKYCGQVTLVVKSIENIFLPSNKKKNKK